MTSRAVLRDIDMFRDLSDAHLDRVATAAQAVTVKRGETITREGEVADRLFAVLSGVVEVGRTARDGRFIRLARLERGEVFEALRVAGAGGRAGTTVAAVVPETHLLAWDAAILRGMMSEDPALGQALLRALVGRLSVRLHSASEAVFTLLQAMNR